MEYMITEIKKELTQHLIPFWKKLWDEKYGGFYGYMSYDLSIDRKAPKGCILNSRILWFFSEACRILDDESCFRMAEHAYRFMREHFLDPEQGGLFWLVSHDGNVLDETKHAYSHAFAVYALSAYYRVSRDQEALELAEELFTLMEEKMRNGGGYGEAFDRSFRPASNEKLSENGVSAQRTMNTLLHIMEAYTLLLQVSGLENVRESLRNILFIMMTRVYNRKEGRLEVFFDREYKSLIDLYSYGHDIEAAWLTDRAALAVGDLQLIKEVGEMTKVLEARVYEEAFDGHSLPVECEKGVVNTKRVWWVQAEAVNGFLNAWSKRPEEKQYLEAAAQIWDYIKTYLIDPREGSEWFWMVNENGESIKGEPIVEPWKCPYHNGRMCLEILETYSGLT